MKYQQYSWISRIVVGALVVAGCHAPAVPPVVSEALRKQVEDLRKENQQFKTYIKVQNDLVAEQHITLEGNFSLDKKDAELSKILQDVKPAVVKIQPIIISESMGDLAIVAQGSGVIISSDGYVITNSHCIPHKYQSLIGVITAKGQKYIAQIKKRDVQKDLALLKLQAVKDNLPYLEFGDSSTLAHDDRLFMIGYPAGCYSGSAGYWRGSTDSSERSLTFIHCDYLNFSGASGGAVVNDKKKLMAINQGIMFRKTGICSNAIPANSVQEFMQKYIVEFNNRKVDIDAQVL